MHMRAGLLMVLGALSLLAFLVHRERMDARLLRSDPDTVARNASLYEYALSGGRSVFIARCAACHGEDGRGDPARGIPNLTDDDWLYGEGLVSDIERVVMYGIRSNDPKAWNLAHMPAFGRDRTGVQDGGFPVLTPRQIHDVIEYLLALEGRPTDGPSAGRGETVYKVEGGCYDCHSEDAKGNPAIGAPNLIDPITLYGDGGRQSLFDSIAYGRSGVCPAWQLKLSPLAIREVAVYVFSLSHAGSLDPAKRSAP
jgi:cbb3-type cytochrome c oxidase subunit III